MGVDEWGWLTYQAADEVNCGRRPSYEDANNAKSIQADWINDFCKGQSKDNMLRDLGDIHIIRQWPTCFLCGNIKRQGHHHNGDWATRRPHILCSICFHSFAALAKAVRLFIASLHSQPMYPKMCYLSGFVKLQPVDWNWRGELYDPPVLELGWP